MNDRSHREIGEARRLGWAIRTMQLPIPTLSQERDRVFVPGYVQYDVGAGQVAVRSGCRQNRFLCCQPSAGNPHRHGCSGCEDLQLLADRDRVPCRRCTGWHRRTVAVLRSSAQALSTLSASVVHWTAWMEQSRTAGEPNPDPGIIPTRNTAVPASLAMTPQPISVPGLCPGLWHVGEGLVSQVCVLACGMLAKV